MQSSSPQQGWWFLLRRSFVLGQLPLPPSLPHGPSFDETDSCRTLPKWNLCNQVFLCWSICLFFFFQHRHLLPVALQPLVIRMDFILVMFDAPWMLGCSQSHSTFCLLALLGWNNLCRLHLSRLILIMQLFKRDLSERGQDWELSRGWSYHAPNLHPVVLVHDHLHPEFCTRNHLFSLIASFDWITLWLHNC